MADTPVLWVECEHGGGDDFLHYGDRNVRRVPVGALLIEDADKAAEAIALLLIEWDDSGTWPQLNDRSGICYAEAGRRLLRAACGES